MLASKKDFLLVSIIGALFGIFSIPILENIKPPSWELNFLNALVLILGFLLFANLCLSIAALLGKKYPNLWQFAKYGAAGALSAALDLGVLNLLSLIFQIFSGPLIAVFNGFSIYAGMTNSYFWNKLWAFKKDGGSLPAGRQGIFHLKEYFRFIGATLGSLILGSIIVYMLTTFVAPPDNLSDQLWENIAKLISLPIVIAWNYIFYKFVIFK